MKKFLSLLLMLVILAFVLLSPAIIAEGVNKNIFNIRKQRQQEEYKGTIVFWHVVSFKTGQGSGYSMLKARSTRFEQNTPYVFVELSGITAEEAKKRLSDGEKPDVISYPKGFADEYKLVAVEKNDDICEKLSNMQQNSYPYMFDSYVLLVNGELFYENGIQLPFGELMTQEVFYAAVNNIGGETKPLSLSDTAGIDAARTLEHLYFSNEETGLDMNCDKNTAPGCALGAESFLDGQSAMYICPYSEYKSLQNDKRADAINIKCYPVSDYTDLIQCIGVYKNQDKAKEKMCLRLAGSILGKGFQQQLETLEMFPVILSDDIYDDNYERKTQYARLMENGIFG